MGDLNLDNNVNDGASPIDVPVARVLTHERYNAQEYTNDIALLKLNYSVNYSSEYFFNVIFPVPEMRIMYQYRSRKYFLRRGQKRVRFTYLKTQENKKYHCFQKYNRKIV